MGNIQDRVLSAFGYDITNLSDFEVNELVNDVNSKISEYKNNQIPTSNEIRTASGETLYNECSCNFKDDDHGGIIKHFRE